MTIAVFLWFVGSLLVGLALVLAGLRGRRVNSNPHCGQCGFDVTGILPTGSMCPECGAGIRLAKYVRIGRRRRVWSLIVIGLPLVMLPIVPLGIAGFAAMTQTPLADYKPLRLLLWEASTQSGKQVVEASVELHERQMSGRLSKADYDLVVETVLGIQRDPSRAWTPELGKIISQARLDGKLKEEAFGDYLAASAVMRWSSRARVHAGGSLVIKGDLVESRTGPQTDAEVYEVLERVRLGDTRIHETKLPISFEKLSPGYDEWGGRGGRREFQSVTVTLDAKNGLMRGMLGRGLDESAVWFDVKVPADTKPGLYDLELISAAAGTSQDLNSPMVFFGLGGSASPDARKPRWTRTPRTLQIEVLAPEAPAITHVEPTAELDAAIRAMLTPTVMVYGNDRGYSLSMTFNIAKAPVPVAFRVSCRVGERTEYLGMLTSGDLPPASLMPDGGNGATFTRTFSASGQAQLFTTLSGEFVEKDVELVFTPDDALATKTVDVTQVYGGEVVVPGVRFATRSPTARVAAATGAAAMPSPPLGTDVAVASTDAAPPVPVEEEPVTVEHKPVRKRSLLSWLFGS